MWLRHISWTHLASESSKVGRQHFQVQDSNHVCACCGQPVIFHTLERLME